MRVLVVVVLVRDPNEPSGAPSVIQEAASVIPTSLAEPQA